RDAALDGFEPSVHHHARRIQFSAFHRIFYNESSFSLMVETIQWTDAGVVMIDQTRLPFEQIFVTCRSYEEVATAIRDMIIRGAPAIGVAAAMGVAIGVLQTDEANLDAGFEQI